ncbi:MAG TPA: hypothetical protein VL049_23135 [Candidatus Dormibacteraeota bacterium]|nr:hypothetical protein [Candidatus Dormibacteraeota bacterium]
MKGAFRSAALAIGLAVSATMALADGSSDVTDNDRMWANFTREAATVGDRHFWIELQGMKLSNDQQIKQPDVNDPTKNVEGPTLGLNGYPVKPYAEKKGSNVTSIDGGTFNLVGAYGLESWEVGGNLPFVMQQQVSFATERPQEDANIGDMVLYGKYKLPLADHWAGGLGVEMSIPSGPESELLGSGDLGLNPFLSTRYQSGRAALGGHLGFLLNTGSQPQVFNWSVEGVVRGTQHFSLRTEINGRLFNDVGSTFNDIAVYPGLDINLFDHVIIRPEGLAHLTSDAINWGIGLGLVFTM